MFRFELYLLDDVSIRSVFEDYSIRFVFHFGDATSIVTKNTTWAERDVFIQAGESALNNRTVKQYSADKQPRFGCKMLESIVSSGLI